MTMAIKGRLRESTQYEVLAKPETVIVGQVWRHSWMQGRPLVVLEIKQQLGCSTSTFKTMVLWALFRKGTQEEVKEMLLSKNWEYLGVIFDDNQKP
jgi:hypothetical protein